MLTWVSGSFISFWVRESSPLTKYIEVLGTTLNRKLRLCGLLRREGQERELSLKTLMPQVSLALKMKLFLCDPALQWDRASITEHMASKETKL